MIDEPEHEYKAIPDNMPCFTGVDMGYRVGCSELCLIFSGEDAITHKMVFVDRDEFQNFINYLVKGRDTTWGDRLQEENNL